MMKGDRSKDISEGVFVMVQYEIDDKTQVKKYVAFVQKKKS